MNSNGRNPGIHLSEEEAFALLGLCMTSPQAIDATAERAMHKLAEFCKSRICPHSLPDKGSACRPEVA